MSNTITWYWYYHVVLPCNVVLISIIGNVSYFRSVSVTVIPSGVTLKLTVVNFLAASSVDRNSTVRCIALAPVNISTSHFPRYIREPTEKQNENYSTFDDVTT